MSTTDGSRRNSRCSPAESTSKLFRESSEKRQAHGLPLPTEGERHMSQIPEVVVPTYDHLVLLDRSIEYDRPSLITFLFRGHARSDWHLVPSLVRQVTPCGLSASEALAVERSARIEFVRQAHLYLPAMLITPHDDAM